MMALPSQISPLIGIPLTLVLSCLLAEFFGYWMHRLLHSDKIPFPAPRTIGFLSAMSASNGSRRPRSSSRYCGF